MADPTICSIKWCNKSKVSEAYCQSHLDHFLKTGKPTKHPRNTVSKYVDSLKSGVEGCIDWPFSVGMYGYPRHTRNRFGTTVAHRVVCIIHHGPPPFEGAEAAHECGNKRCVNPDHISWKTKLENNHDKFRHGTMMMAEKHFHAILKDHDIPEIRSMRKSGMSNVAISKIYGVAPCTISHICNRTTWRSIP